MKLTVMSGNVHIYYDLNVAFLWDFEIDGVKEWGEQMEESDLGLSDSTLCYMQKFTITSNNIDYTQCEYITGGISGIEYLFVRVPV